MADYNFELRRGRPAQPAQEGVADVRRAVIAAGLELMEIAAGEHVLGAVSLSIIELDPAGPVRLGRWVVGNGLGPVWKPES